MRTATEYFDEYFSHYASFVDIDKEDVLKVITIAQKDTIEECAKVAKAKLISTAFENALSGASYLATITNPSKCYVDKESILSLINKLQ